MARRTLWHPWPRTSRPRSGANLRSGRKSRVSLSSLYSGLSTYRCPLHVIARCTASARTAKNLSSTSPRSTTLEPVIRSSKRGRYLIDEISTDLLPSGRTSRRWRVAIRRRMARSSLSPIGGRFDLRSLVSRPANNWAARFVVKLHVQVVHGTVRFVDRLIDRVLLIEAASVEPTAASVEEVEHRRELVPEGVDLRRCDARGERHPRGRELPQLVVHRRQQVGLGLAVARGGGVKQA